MSDHPKPKTPRKVLAWITLSIDGFAAGPGNDTSRIFFPDGLPPSDWRLITVATFATGVVALRYGRS